MREVIPTIFKFMKDSKIHRPKDLFSHVTDTLARQGFEPKRLATNFALTWLEKEGLVEHLQRGSWRITSKGKQLEEMTSERATEIERKHDPALSRRILSYNEQPVPVVSHRPGKSPRPQKKEKL